MSDKNAGADSDKDSEEIVDSTDYGFILSEDGELKSFMMPINVKDEDLPENVILILDILGIDITAPKESRMLH